MFGWKARRRRWRQLSGHQQVETSTRWMIKAYPWAMLVFQLPTHLNSGRMTTVLSIAVCVLGVVECVIVLRSVDSGLECYLGRGPVPRARLGLLAGLLLATTGLACWLIALDEVQGSMTVPLLLYGASSPLTLLLGLTTMRRTALRLMTGYAVGAAACLGLAGDEFPEVLGTAIMLTIGTFAGVFTGRSSAWYIDVMRKLDEAREAHSRLAVAEERLRFGRDLHDVMGRNLSVIALKSELAVQLAQRACDRPEEGPGAATAAIEQMAEVQRIARDSQSEVRAVVRGYREAGLPTELAGARAVLRAAGVDCRVETGGSAELPEGVQSALGWVVREAATNVLRHADASHCTVRVGTGRGGRMARLVMENDGVRASKKAANGGASSAGWSEGGGSGLLGLHERLAVLGGTLVTEQSKQTGTFRLTAEVPLSAGESAEPPPSASHLGEDGPQAGERSPGAGGADELGGEEDGRRRRGNWTGKPEKEVAGG